jgi:hypothetical protein
MRDSTFTLQALHWLNLDWEADEFMQFVADLEPNDDGALQVMYGDRRPARLTESTRDELSGYAGARPVRIGNGAFDQRQNDVFGAVLDSVLLHARSSQRCRAACGRSWSRRRSARPRVERTRPGHLGGARRPTALRLLEADVWVALDRRRSSPRSAALRSCARAGSRPQMRSGRTSSSAG